MECNRCGYKTERKGDLVKHLRKVNICSPNISDLDRNIQLSELCGKVVKDVHFVCEFCDQKFNNKSNMYRHRKICKKKDIDNVDNLKEEMNNLKQELERVKHQVNNQSCQTNINNVNNNITTNNIQINSFGQENLDHLPKDFLTSCFMMKNIPSLIENIYFDEECPENHNVKLRSSKNKTANIYDDGKWKVRPVDRIIDEMVNKGQTILSKHYKFNKECVEEEMSEDEIMEVIDWLQKIWNDNIKVRKPLKEDIMAILMSYKDE